MQSASKTTWKTIFPHLPEVRLAQKGAHQI
jgi:hypothetical protein